FVGDSLAGILAPVWDRADDFRTFIIARRALNLLKSDKTMPRGAPREALDAYCFKNFGLSYYVLKNAYDSASFAFRAASAKLDAFNNNNLRLLVDGGIISREFAAKMEKNLGYVPFRRLLELESPNVSQSSASDSSPIHARRGSAREIIDPLQTIMENAVIFREIAQKNLIKMGLVDSVSKLSGYGKILEQDIERLKATAVDRESVARAIVEARLASEVLGVDTADMSKQEQVELVAQKISESNPLFQFFMWARDVRANPSKQVITVLRGGKREAWKIRDKGVYDALMALDGGAAKIFNVFADATTNVIDKFLRGSGSLMKFTATNNIRFSISNFVRDQLTAAVFTSSEQGFIPFISTFTKGLWASITHNADYREWVANGGYNSNFVGETGKMSLEDVVGAKSSAPRRVAGHVRREAGEGAWRGVKALVNVAVEPLRRTAETLESATRIAEHKLNKEDYVSRFGLEAWRNDAAARRRAANASKSVTINFAEGGSFAKFMNRYVPFFNAWAQGLRKTFIEALPVNIPLALKYIAGDRSFGASKVYNDNGAAKLVKMLANTAILMMLKAALAPDDEDDIPEWQRETCWTFQDGEGNIIAIPKDYEALPIYEAFERAFGADRKSGFWNFMLVQILAPNLMPPAVKAVVEHSANKSFFRDAPIVSRGIENLPTRYKYYPTTSQTLRALSSGLEDVFGEYAPSPVILDHYVNAFTTGLGREALWWLDRAGEVVGGRQKSVNSSFDFSPSNPLSKFRTNPFAASGSLEIFYEARNEAQGFFALENKLKSGEIKNGLKPYEIRRLEWYSARKRDIGQVSKAIESYNRQIRAALGDESLDGAEKQRMVKMFVKMRNDLAKRAKDLKYSDAAYGAWRKEVEKDAVLRGF
ncbi:MAG: hypothetical protein J6P03_06065, partial [Opitutales bacterium]|nr:hypothetical protein [Opitutales bacterium]